MTVDIIARGMASNKKGNDSATEPLVNEPLEAGVGIDITDGKIKNIGVTSISTPADDDENAELGAIKVCTPGTNTKTRYIKPKGIAEAAFKNVLSELTVSDDLPTGNAVYKFIQNIIKLVYKKPDDGIPESDLSTEIKNKLALAVSALQSYTETDPTVPDWAKQKTKPVYTANEVGALPANTEYGTYTKPDDGIPEDDLSKSVRDLLAKASTAIQEEQYKGTYSKPDSGIPESDLSKEVKDLLDKASTAVQEEQYKGTYSIPSSGIPVSDLSEEIKTLLNKAKTALQNETYKGTYTKPSTGIPKSDLSEEIKNLLALASTALQSYTETDPTVPDWAKASSKPSYTKSEVGLGNVGNYKAVSTVSGQGLTETEKQNARNNIGASSFSGNYADLANLPVKKTVPTLGTSYNSPLFFDGIYNDSYDLTKFGSEALLGLYDALANRGLFTKELLGNGVYAYRITHSVFTNTSGQTENVKPKVVLYAGQSGKSKSGIYTLYNFARQIDLEDSSDLNIIREYVDVIIIPIIDIPGFNGKAYADNSDILKDFISSEENIICTIGLSDTSETACCFNVMSNEHLIFAKTVLNILTYQWKDKYSNVVFDSNSLLGSCKKAATGGLVDSINTKNSCFEIELPKQSLVGNKEYDVETAKTNIDILATTIITLLKYTCDM